jgi:CubicO group peptidase (beta-lactamase class C family)
MNALRNQEDHRTHGVLIARHGRLVFEQYFPGHRRHAQEETTAFDRDTIHDLASVTKSVTATLLGIVIDRGIIADVHRSLFGFFPEYAHLNDGTKDGVTLEHVVTMTAGLEWNEWGYALTDDRNDLVQFNQSANPLGFALAKPMVAVPGTVFAYSGANSMLLGDVIRRASGVRLDSVAQESLFTPLGIFALDWKYYWYISPDLVAAHGDLELRPRDMLKLGQLHLQQGVWNGERVLSSDWVQTAATPYYSFPYGFTGHLEGLVGYSHGWWVRSADYGSGAFSASGWGDQAIIVMPDFDMVAVFTGGSYWEPPFLTSHEMMVGYVLPSVRQGSTSSAGSPIN